MNDEAARQGRYATSNITAADDTTEGGRCWPRCSHCGARFVDDDHLYRHRVRNCVGAGWRAMRLLPPRRRS